jgi:hypothetical protein
MTIIARGITAGAELVEPGLRRPGSKASVPISRLFLPAVQFCLQLCDLCACPCSDPVRDEVPDETPRPVDEDKLVG